MSLRADICLHKDHEKGCFQFQYGIVYMQPYKEIGNASRLVNGSASKDVFPIDWSLHFKCTIQNI